MKKACFTNQVKTTFFITLFKTIFYVLFSRPTAFSRINQINYSVCLDFASRTKRFHTTNGYISKYGPLKYENNAIKAQKMNTLSSYSEVLYRFKGEIKKRIGWLPSPATPRHPSPLLQLLPSGPDWVHNLSSRGDQRGSPLRARIMRELS